MHIRCGFDRCELEERGWCGLNSATEINECEYYVQKETIQRKEEAMRNMAEYVSNFDIDDDICKNVNCDYAIYDESNCINCIIEYFGGK